jgi:murein DD-endopeptidase MepM/ murein hydrolase activator NlpD
MTPETHKPTSGQNVPKSTGGKFKRDKEQSRPSDRLRRDKDETPPTGDTHKRDKKTVRDDKRFDKSRARAEKSGIKLDAARKGLDAQKPRKRPGAIKTLGRAAAFEVWGCAHGKIHEAEHENVGIEAAHKTELAGEKTVGGTARHIQRRVRTRPARRVRKWEKRDVNAAADYRFRQTAREHPEVKQNAARRYLQKKRLQKQYQKQAKETAKQGARVAEKTAVTTEKLVREVAAFVKRHPTGVLLLLCAVLLIVILQSCVAGALSIGNGLTGAVDGTSYLAADGDIDAAELAYTEWETDLELAALNAPSSHPGYDEYRFNLAPTGHDPHALLAYLTAKHDDFTFAAVQGELQGIFNQQYSLTFTPTVEVRYRTEPYVYTDPATGEIRTGNRQVPYNYYILTVTLTARAFTEIITPSLTPEEQERYALYLLTKGNRQYVGSPFPYNWLPYVSSFYGYRVHPISGEKNYHTGADIALPIGTEIQAGGDGVILEAGTNGGYGLCLLVDYGDGITARYAHCSALLATVGQTVTRGEVIARVGNTGNSTGAHLHIEVLRGGQYMNPLYFVEIPYD